VAYMFEQCGLISVDAGSHSEDELLVAVDAGATEIDSDEDRYEILTAPADLATVRSALEGEGISFESAELVQRPTVRVELDAGEAATLMRLIDALEENDDVGEVHANFDIDAEVMEKIAG
ncbi:MAG: YebC/PmpR family DNA-binding transcriptional regulator, partial [Solirubrobacterales bacterium]